MSKYIFTIGMLAISNIFMTLAWYGHLRFSNVSWLQKGGLWAIILISWGIALLEYCFQVPANKYGFNENGGPFSLLQLKILQEVLSLVVFMFFTLFFFKNEQFRWNHLAAFGLIIIAVYLVFKK